MIISWIILFFVFSCNNGESQHHNYDREMILGEWMLEGNAMNYPGLLFNHDSIAIFYSRYDTIYRFHYYLKGDSLLLNDMYSNQFYGIISALNDSSLIFSKLIEHDKKQIYKRK